MTEYRTDNGQRQFIPDDKVKSSPDAEWRWCIPGYVPGYVSCLFIPQVY